MPEKRSVSESRAQQLLSLETVILTNNSNDLNNDQEYEIKEYEISIQANNLKSCPPPLESSIESPHFINDSFYEDLINKKINFDHEKNDFSSSKLRGNKSMSKTNSSGIPQTLISCLDDLQSSGNLVSWKIAGHGDNLSVKVTWNNDNQMSKNLFDNERIKGLSLNKLNKPSDGW